MLFAFEDLVRSWLMLSACAIGSVVIAWLRRPSIMLDAYAWYKIMVANLRIRYITVDGVLVRYGVRLSQSDANAWWWMITSSDILNKLGLQRAGDGMSEKGLACAEGLEKTCESHERPRSVVLFVHGFSSDLTTWYNLVRAVDANDTVYCVDLPGHGGSERQPTHMEDVSVMGLARFLRSYVEAMHLDKSNLHLVGQSLGGAIVGVYSGMYPDHVAALTLISPAVEPPFLTEFAERLNARDYSWLLPTSLDGCNIVLQRNLANRRMAEQIPKQIKMVSRLQMLPSFKQEFNSLPQARF